MISAMHYSTILSLYLRKINSVFHYRAETITKTVSAIVAPFSGTVFLLTSGKQSPLGNLNDYSKNCKARHSWKAAFLI